jgi:hypothetical protein
MRRKVPVRKNMHKHFVDVLDATVDSDSGHGDQEIPYDGRARGLHRARVVGMVGSVGEGVAERQGGLGVESRDLTQIDRSHEALREKRCL